MDTKEFFEKHAKLVENVLDSMSQDDFCMHTPKDALMDIIAFILSIHKTVEKVLETGEKQGKELDGFFVEGMLIENTLRALADGIERDEELQMIVSKKIEQRIAEMTGTKKKDEHLPGYL